jgi:hypothetical protein
VKHQDPPQASTGNWTGKLPVNYRYAHLSLRIQPVSERVRAPNSSAIALGLLHLLMLRMLRVIL